VTDRTLAISNPTHIYVLGFSDGILKVGRTSNPHQRMILLRHEAKKRGATITNQWVTEFANAIRGEHYLIRVGAEHFPQAWGKEYFCAGFDEYLTVLYGAYPLKTLKLPNRCHCGDAAVKSGDLCSSCVARRCDVYPIPASCYPDVVYVKTEEDHRRDRKITAWLDSIDALLAEGREREAIVLLRSNSPDPEEMAS
jgi:hypothetical protein